MIYFDSAATTLQKPSAVSKAVTRAMTNMASPGRGDSSASASAADIMFACREAVAELFHVPEPEQVVFTFNATHALNIAIKSVVKSGQKVLISGYEHNAVSRPLASIPGIQVRVLNTPLFEPEQFLERLEVELSKGIDLMVCTYVSNVFGYILPLEQVAKLCSAWNVPFIVDASQAAGTLPINMEALEAAFIAMPGHKGLYGPQGTGLLLCGEKGEPLLFGGTGSLSAQQAMPVDLPERHEAGTQNIPGIAGLLEGIRFVKEKGEQTILRHERRLKQRTAMGLRKLPGISLFESPDPKLQTGLLSFRMENVECETIGEYLSRHHVAVRTGLHCAPLAHASAGTDKSGTVRLSFSAFNTPQQVEQFLKLMRQFVRSGASA